MPTFKKIFFVSLVLAFVLLPVFVFGVEGEEEIQGLVPCGNKGQPDCTLCDFFVLIKKIMDFAALIAIPLAVGFMAYGGIRMAAAGGSEENLKKGRGAITNALIGIFLVFGAWLIIDLIMGNLLKEGVYLPWNKFPQCQQPSVGTGAPLAPGVISGAALTAGGESSFRINVRSLIPCKSSTASSITDYVNHAELNGVEPQRVRAIIIAESWGDPTAITRNSDGTYSCGLMQVSPSTAKKYDSTILALKDPQICDKLTKDANFNINIGTKYYSAMLKKYNGDTNLASAAYNGGPKANDPSANCPGLKKWQCLYDSNGCYNTSRTDCVPNTGYAPTRKYIDNINKYYVNPSC